METLRLGDPGALRNAVHLAPGFSPLDRRYREQFLKVLDHPAVVEHSRRTAKAGEQLMLANEALVKSLKEVREKLSLEHDVPYVGAIELSLQDTL